MIHSDAELYTQVPQLYCKSEKFKLLFSYSSDTCLIKKTDFSYISVEAHASALIDHSTEHQFSDVSSNW